MNVERTLTIPSDHPALPGHFPGHPIVPGVVVLDEVIETLKRRYGGELLVTELPAVKLSSPLRPEVSGRRDGRLYMPRRQPARCVRLNSFPRFRLMVQ
jgi:3-hydroxymyristoyl/3-hydroxydecanoyl-(acyl carrier protein) dehydratase